MRWKLTMTTRVTEEFLIEKLKKFVEEYGRTPLLKEFGHSGNIHRFFGTYTNFLESQGFDKKRTIKNKGELVKELHAFVKANNRMPKASEFGYFSLVRRYYGSSYEFFKANGYEPLLHDNQMSSQKSEELEKPNDPVLIESLINKLAAYVEEHGHTPTAKEMGHERQIKKIFGSFSAFIHSQGFATRRGITKSKLEQKFGTFVEVNGRIPTSVELGHRSAVQRLYGNYPAFLKANGYEREYQLKARKNYVSKEFLISKLITFVEEHGQTPTATEMGYKKSIINYFGSYTAFIRSQGFTTCRGITKSKLEQKYRTFFEANGRKPTIAEFGHYAAIQRLYGNYSEFLKANGYVKPEKKKKKTPSAPKPVITSAFLKEELNKFVDENGRIPTPKELGYSDFIAQKFGSYTALLHSQGYKLPSEQLSKEELQNKLRTYVKITGELPKYAEFGYRTSIKKLFGSFEAFVQATGYEP